MQIPTRAVAATRRFRAIAPNFAAGLLMGHPTVAPPLLRPEFPPYGAPVGRATAGTAPMPSTVESSANVPTLSELQSPRDRRRRFQFPSFAEWCALREW